MKNDSAETLSRPKQHNGKKGKRQKRSTQYYQDNKERLQKMNRD